MIRSLCKKAEKNYFETKFKKYFGDGRRTWDTINEVLNRKKTYSKIPRKLITEDGTILTDRQNMSELYNNYFTNIGIELSQNFSDSETLSYDFRPQTVTETFDNVVEYDVKKYIRSININKSPGIDNLHPKLLKEAADYISQPLTYIFNLSLSTGLVPTKLKAARVVPIFKGSGNPESPGNYRPISILPVCAKILEKIVYEQISQKVGNCLYMRQYGFRKGVSTSEAIRDLVDNLHNNIHKGHTSTGVFIDFKKAFDTVNHDILLRKMEGYGFRSIARKWLEDYLSGRTQIVKLKDTISSSLPFRVGVPQGSILGPLLFLLYINDVKDCILSGKLRLFADDMNIFYSSRDVNTMANNIQGDMCRLDRWFKNNKLTVNAKKCNYIIVKSPNKVVPDINVHLQSNLLERADKVKYLGVYIDQHLTFRAHVDYLCQKISPSIGILGRIRWKFPLNIRMLLYNALIHSHLAYCVESWGSASNLVMDPLEKLQKRAVRFVSCSDYYAHTAPIFQMLEKQTVRQLFFSKICYIVHRELQGLSPGLNFGFQRVDHGYATRSVVNDYLRLPDHTTGLITNAIFRTLSYVGPRFYNILPSNIRNINSMSLFKRHVRSYIISNHPNVYHLMFSHRV